MAVTIYLINSEYMQDQNDVAAPSEIAQLFNRLLRRRAECNRIEPLSDCVLFLKQVVPVCVSVEGMGLGRDWGRLVFFLFFAPKACISRKF